MHDSKQSEAEFLISCMWIKSLSEYTPSELKEYCEEKQALEKMEQNLLNKSFEKGNEYEPEYNGDENLN